MEDPSIKTYYEDKRSMFAYTDAINLYFTLSAKGVPKFIATVKRPLAQ